MDSLSAIRIHKSVSCPERICSSNIPILVNVFLGTKTAEDQAILSLIEAEK